MELAALEVKLSADFQAGFPAINKLVGSLDTIAGSAGKVNAVLDNTTRTLAKTTAATAAQAGGMTALSNNAIKLADSVAHIPKTFDENTSALNSFVDAFNAKWNPIVENAQRLAIPLEESAAKLAQFQQQVKAFGGGIAAFNTIFKTEGADSVLNQSKLIVDAINGIPVNKTIQFQLSGNTREALSDIAALSAEIKELGNGGAVSIQKIETALGQLRSASANATNIADIQKYDAAINHLKADLSLITETAKKSGVSLSNLGVGSGTAALALGNVGRVLQDLPFGFIGIANNLNPLLESFQRLSAEAKITGTSITTGLLKSLVGGGGLGLALSAVTAAFSFASFGLQFWTRGMGKSKEAADSNKKAVDEYTQALNRSYDAAAQQLTQVSIFVANAEKRNATLAELKKTLADLQGVSDTYFGKLKIENGLVVGLADAYAAYADNILKVARAKAAEETIQKLSAELVKTSDAVNGVDSGLTNLNLTFGQANKLLAGQTGKSAFDALADASKRVNDIVEKGLPTFEDIKFLADATGKSEAQINRILADRGSLKTKEAQLLAQIASLSQFVAANETKTTAATKERGETVAKILAELQKQLTFLDAKELNEGLDESHEKINAIEDAIKKLIDINIPADSTLIKKLFGDISVIQLPETLRQFGEFVKKLEQSIPAEKAPKIPVTIQPVFNKEAFDDLLNRSQVELQAKTLHLDIDTSHFSGNEIKTLLKPLNDIEEINQKLQDEFGIGLPTAVNKANRAFEKLAIAKVSLYDLNKAAQTFVQGLATDSIVAFGEAIGSAITGGNAGNVFKAFFETLGEGLKTFGEEIIAAAPLIKGIKATLFSNPLLAIPAGIALIAIGSIIENKIPKLSQGGIIPPGYNDNFPAFLNSHEAVIPLDKLNQYLEPASQKMEIVVSGTLEGQGDKLLATINRAERKRYRTY